ncbi:MAG: hypothetical protein DHS20C17_31370 [Cyclobacteriaceae bacterium]|nr:MAG: hypothetical protein DHS20C17_31370 [Cyclobacteriaceae bacterium]
MINYSVKALEPGDSNQLLELLKTRENINEHDAEVRTQLQEWIAFHNPFQQNEETTYYVVQDKDKIIAFHGRMPVKFNFKGACVNGYYVHDLYVHPDFRKKGQGFWLTMSLAKAIEKDTRDPFCLLGMTPLNLEMQRRRGYYETEVDGYHKLTDPLKQVTRVFKNRTLSKLLNVPVKLTLAFIDYLLGAIYKSEIEVGILDRFDQRTDDLFTRVKSKIGISTCKQSDYLNWKYIDRPHSRETVLVSTLDNQTTGFMVISLSPYPDAYARGFIIDLLVDPDDKKSLHALLISAIKFFRNSNVYSIHCLLSDQRYVQEFKKFLFTRKIGKKMLLGNCENQSDYKSISNWHMTLGESDAFMLNT